MVKPYEPNDDDPLAYMTTDSASGYGWESRQGMISRYARGSRRQTGWRRVIVLLVRVAFAILLAFFVVGTALAVDDLWRDAF